jgi:predicted Zn-dependent protease
MVQYLNKIANALAFNSARPDRNLARLYNGYHAAVLDSAEINAFATSGGHIFVTRGLLQCAASEDALAAVLAHEIAHIQLQHSIKAIKTSRITQALMYTGASVVGAATTGTSLEELTSIFDESVTDIVSTMINNGYSRSQEFDADDLALSLLASAGYDPRNLLDMLQELDKNQSPGGFNKTHPAPRDRITNANRKLGAYKVSDTDTRSFRRARFIAAK